MTWITTPESSSIAGFGYDARRMVLTIEFKATRARYQYFEVPEPVFQEMRRAESKGRYFAHHVRGLFRYARL